MRTVFIVSLFIFLLAACRGDDLNQDDQRYTGQSNQWVATINVKEKIAFELVYEGTELAIVNDISFTIEISDRGYGGSDFRLNDNGSLNMEFDWYPMNLDDETFEVTIEWDGDQEMIELIEE